MSDAWGGPPSGGDWQQGGGPYPGPDSRWPAGRLGGSTPAQVRGPLFEDTDESDEFVYSGQRRSVPEQRGAAESPAGGRAERRRGAGAGAGAAAGAAVTPERRRPAAVSASVLIALPLVGALVSGGGGVVLDITAVLGALVAALLCSRPGVWWVTTGAPPVVLLMALAGFVVRDSAGSTGKFATDLAKCVAGAFPAMAAAMAVAVVVGVARLVAARRGR